ncbi:hypothetical protein, partial [Gemmiger sp.]|uniref:hypothetical protein n=1 Tax=Gemmiger sp. TaxID=2049027 RepID=UPI002A76442A
RAIRRDFMRCAQPAVRQGHCARRRVSERNRRTAAALGAEIDTRPTLLPQKGLFDKLKFAKNSSVSTVLFSKSVYNKKVC